MDDEETMVDKGQCSAADVLQLSLEKKLMLQPEDRDMVVMLHEIQYMKESVAYKATGSFVLKGKDGKHTAMAQTVGLPLAIAAKLILHEKLNLKGLHIPVIREIYDPVLQELALQGIQFSEETMESI